MVRAILAIVLIVACSLLNAQPLNKSMPNGTKALTDVRKLVHAASRLMTAWPWQGPIKEVDSVVQHGKRVAPCLVGLLTFDSTSQDMDIDLHVEQQIELALCKIYNLVPESGKTIYGIRSAASENRRVKPFWWKKVFSQE